MNGKKKRVEADLAALFPKNANLPSLSRTFYLDVTGGTSTGASPLSELLQELLKEQLCF